jgi:hypothetical protein
VVPTAHSAARAVPRQPPSAKAGVGAVAVAVGAACEGWLGGSGDGRHAEVALLSKPCAGDRPVLLILDRRLLLVPLLGALRSPLNPPTVLWWLTPAAIRTDSAEVLSAGHVRHCCCWSPPRLLAAAAAARSCPTAFGSSVPCSSSGSSLPGGSSKQGSSSLQQDHMRRATRKQHSFVATASSASAAAAASTPPAPLCGRSQASAP